ncbi:hypothetical protein ACFVZW_19475 [Streptomyces sp. NPDC059567]|uniref:hypothetical protein n=1 Tax=Streptomyces sp. NPDC059567 TaxID=3346867 RepID=UPI003686A345
MATLEPPSAPPPAPAPDAGAEPFPGHVRRSADASLAALTAGPLPLPLLPATTAADVPATFRSEGLADEPAPAGPTLGALSLSAVLAVALAALRGTVTFVADWRQRRMERAAEEAAWREAKVKRLAAEEDARARLAKVPNSAEYGRKAVQGGRKAASGSSGSAKPGTGVRTAQGASVGPVKKPGPAAPPKPVAKDPAKPRVPDAKGKVPAGPKALGKTGDKKPATDTGKPSKPSSGLVAPGKGKGNGGSGKGALERARDRKVTDGKKPGSGLARKPGGKGGGQENSGKPASKNQRDPAAGAGPVTAKPGSGQKRRRFRKGNGPKPVKKVPGIKHGTAEGYDVHECRCRRCRKAADGRNAPKPGPGSTAPGGTSRPSGARRLRDRVRKNRDNRRRDRPGGSGQAGPNPPPRGGRRSADDLHTASAWTETVITVERVDRPGDQARPARPAPAAVTTGVRGLPRAPQQPAGPRPGTTTPKETPPVAVTVPSVHLSAPAGVAAEHLTEVTLDDVLDHLAASKRRCFATYDECAVLADQARKLRRSLEELADELAERHNLIGRLTSAAMTRLAEAMDLLARKAEQMRTESLQAAEKVEAAHDAMHDAYRPVQAATVDAGLVMPSARIHNDD